MSKFIGAIDQGTTGSRFLIFNEKKEIIVGMAMEHTQITPAPGSLEHNPEEIFANVVKCIKGASAKFHEKYPGAIVEAVGITNQRETTVAWDSRTGKSLTNAIVWSDNRTAGVMADIIAKVGNGNANVFKEVCGLPVSTYFSATKMVWMLQNVPEVKEAMEGGYLRFGTVDSWIIYNLTNRAVHVTDVTNASRTMLMNLKTLSWEQDHCDKLGIQMATLPKIVSCSEVMGTISAPQLAGSLLYGAAIAGCVGDQQGALVGQFCLEAGQAKNTYGTGCFLLTNVGTEVKPSDHGLLATVGFKFGDGPAFYALEGSVAGAGSCVQWLRDKLQVVSSAKDCDVVAASVSSTEGVVFVPAFSGLLAPYWRPDARGLIIGLTQQTTKQHVVRAALEAVSYQVGNLITLMELDSGSTVSRLAVDGGMVASKVLMQMQADVSQIQVCVPGMLESTALGAAICAGVAVKAWDLEAMKADAKTRAVTTYGPKKSLAQMKPGKARWEEAVKRTFGWAKL